MRIEIKPIGTVNSGVTETRDEDWGNVVSQIKFLPEYAAGLKGMESFSHIVVIYWMHEAEFDPARHLLRRPRDREDMPLLGIFAQRARHRPNPVGITTVRLLSAEDDTLRVQGLDAIHGTPVLDVKPYFPEYDRARDAVTPDWVRRLMDHYFE